MKNFRRKIGEFVLPTFQPNFDVLLPDGLVVVVIIIVIIINYAGAVITITYDLMRDSSRLKSQLYPVPWLSYGPCLFVGARVEAEL